MHRIRIFILLTALLGIISCFLPWVSYSIERQTVFISSGLNIYDTKLYGLSALLLYLAGAAIALRGDRKRPFKGVQRFMLTAFGVGLVVLFFVFISSFNARIIQEAQDFMSGVKHQELEYGFGTGIWLGLVAALLFILLPPAFRYLGKTTAEDTAA
ncbi:MAG: hypothetical protein KF690_12175 [Bacteroidetes bacterium]|nr:hypothetical protein [Bacteroidota bacterium]